MKTMTIVYGALLVLAWAASSSVAMADATCAAGDASDISVGRRVSPDEIAAAKTINLIPINSCELSDVASALSSKGSVAVRRSIQANPVLLGEVQSQGFTTADILGAVRQGGTIIVYVTGKDTGMGVTTLLVPGAN